MLSVFSSKTTSQYNFIYNTESKTSQELLLAYAERWWWFVKASQSSTAAMAWPPKCWRQSIISELLHSLADCRRLTVYGWNGRYGHIQKHQIKTTEKDLRFILDEGSFAILDCGGFGLLTILVGSHHAMMIHYLCKVQCFRSWLFSFAVLCLMLKDRFYKLYNDLLFLHSQHYVPTKTESAS